jgi:hypothetical protein
VEATYCSNTSCKKSSTHMGGKFRLIAGQWYCMDCSPNMDVLSPAKNLWDFSTTHFNGHPVHVKSRSHLDQLCKTHGVSNHARENYTRNW